MNKSQFDIQFCNLIEANVSELTKMNLVDNFIFDELRSYAIVLDGYLRSDHEVVKTGLELLENESSLKFISQLRLESIEGLLEKSTLSKVTTLTEVEDTYGGEASYVLGMSYMKAGNNEEAIKFFTKAHCQLTILGAKKKALKALLNILVCKTRLYPNRKYIRDYEMIALKAEEIQESRVEAVCYHNISRELLYVNAVDLALSYSNKALNLLKTDSGTLHFFEVLLNRCHVYIKLGRYEDAHKDYQMAQTSNHPQTVEALECIRLLLEDKTSIKKSQYLEPCWRDKLSMNREEFSKIKPTKLELKFINMIKSTSEERDVIIEKLWGTNLDYDSAQNRLRVFIHRFRKKFPNQLIECDSKLILNADITISA